MLKLSLTPGEFLQLGPDIRIVYSGGSAGNIHLLIDAPKEVNIARSKAMAKHKTLPKGKRLIYEPEPELSKEAQDKIKAIILEEKRKKKNDSQRTTE